MRHSLTILYLGTIFLQSCSNNTAECKISEKDVSTLLVNKTIITSENDTIKEIRDIGEDTITGGYYTFKKGLLKSYYFFTKSDSSYIHKEGDEIIEEDKTTDKVTFCSYAELYNDNGQLARTIDIPLVYRFVKLIGQDTICLNAKFFSLNKTYKDIQIKTNTNFTSKLSLTEDTLFTNMKQGCFQFYFYKKEDVRIYISGTFIQECPKETKSFADTIFLSYKNGKLKSSG